MKLNYLIDDLFLKHLKAENEQIHFLTSLYGVLIENTINETNIEIHQKIAKSFELLKTSTLVTDDFLDKSNFRDNVPSFYNKYGPEQTVLIAEILKSTATISFIEYINKVENLSHSEINECILLFEDTYRVVCIGQLEEIKFLNIQDNNWDEKKSNYWEIIYKTTASFIQLPILVGSIINKYSNEDKIILAKYGKLIGLAYQLRDDLIDIIGDPAIIGKQFGNDIKEKKIRLPLIQYMLTCSHKDKKFITESYFRNNISDHRVVEIIEKIKASNSIDYCIQKINELSKEAKDLLNQLKDKNLQTLLFEFAETLKHKNYD